MPSAAPTSRVVSLTADATPCFSSGAAFMIADVADAVHRPMPMDITVIGHAKSEYVVPSSSVRMQKIPMATSSSPVNNTTRKPSFGRYQKDRTAKMNIGMNSGVSASAVPSGE